MSKPRFNWWPFALNMTQNYPIRREDYRALHEQSTAVDMSGMPRGGSSSRTVENIAVRQLPPQEQREYDAVRKAIEYTRTLPDADIRIRIISMTLWKNTHSIPGAAMVTNISERTAQRYRWQFTLLVGHKYGFLTKEEYQEMISRRSERCGDFTA